MRRAALDADAAGLTVGVLEQGEAVRLWRAVRRLGPGVLPAGRLVLLSGMTSGMGAYLYVTPDLFADHGDGGLVQWRCAVVMETAWRAARAALRRSTRPRERVSVQLALIERHGLLAADLYPAPPHDRARLD